MKSVLLYANQDEGYSSRLNAALCIASQFDATIQCVQVTPFQAVIMGDPFGGVYALPTIVEHVSDAEDRHKQHLEQTLKEEGARWEWLHYEGQPGHVLLERSKLADLTIVSLPQQAGFSLAADLAIHARAPVLALPEHGRGFSCRGDVVIAWNGSRECAHALRLAIPLICRGLKAHVVTIAGARTEMPADDAVHYIKQYGVAAIKHEIESNGQTIAEALFAAAKDFDGYYVVAGAYGHSRLREAVIGGTTRDLLEASDIPLFLAH